MYRMSRRIAGECGVTPMVWDEEKWGLENADVFDEDGFVEFDSSVRRSWLEKGYIVGDWENLSQVLSFKNTFLFAFDVLLDAFDSIDLPLGHILRKVVSRRLCVAHWMPWNEIVIARNDVIAELFNDDGARRLAYIATGYAFDRTAGNYHLKDVLKYCKIIKSRHRVRDFEDPTANTIQIANWQIDDWQIDCLCEYLELQRTQNLTA